MATENKIELDKLSIVELWAWHQTVAEMLAYTERSIQMNKGSYGHGVQLLAEETRRSAEFNRYQRALAAIKREISRRTDLIALDDE